MSQNKGVKPIYTIGDCVFDPTHLTITRGELSAKLSAKVADLMVLFSEQSPEVVEFSTAIELIWDGNDGVGKKAYTNAVWSIRKAFKELNVEEEIFESISKVGYRLLPQVSIKKSKSEKLLSSRLVWPSALSIVVLAFFGLVTYFLNHPKLQFEKEKVTNYEGVEEHISVSPTGQYIAFSWTQNNQSQQMYLRDLTNGNQELTLISTGSGHHVSPSWSPTEKHIAYIEYKESEYCRLKLYDFVLNNEQVLNSDCYYLPYHRAVGWSDVADNAIYYSKQLGDRTAIYEYNITTQAERQRTFPSSGEVDYVPRITDGTLYFIRDNQSPYEFKLYKIGKNGQELEVLSNQAGIVDFDISPTDGRIFINSYNKNQHRVSVLSAEGEPIAQVPTSALPSSIEFSPNNNSLLVSEHISREYLARIDFANKSIVQKVSSNSRDMYGTFLKKTGEIAFLSNRDQSLAIWKSGKQFSKNITPDVENASIPRASNDGNYILARLKEIGDKDNLYVIDMNRQSKRKKLPLPQHLVPNYAFWSISGDIIYFSAFRGKQLGLYSYDFNSKETSQLTDTAEIYGSQLDENTLIVSRRNQSGLWAFNLTSRNFKRLELELAEFDFGSFYADEGCIFYVKRTVTNDLINRDCDGEKQTVYSFPANTIRKFFGIERADKGQTIATLKLANEADIVKYEISNSLF